jgi:hypothetical protein
LKGVVQNTIINHHVPIQVHNQFKFFFYRTIATINWLLIPSNMVVGLRCHMKHQKIKCKLEKFNVLETLSNMLANKEIGVLDGFEGLLRYYMKLTSIWFIKQWVTHELYNVYWKYFIINNRLSTMMPPLFN